MQHHNKEIPRKKSHLNCIFYVWGSGWRIFENSTVDYSQPNIHDLVFISDRLIELARF